MPVLAPALNKLEVTFSNSPAPRPDGENMWVDIDVDLTRLTALFHCCAEEHVGDHSRRTVTFRADHDCVLRFTQRSVFNLDWVHLTAYNEVILGVAETVQKINANYEIWSGTSATKDVAQTVAAPQTGPHIFVP